jgi:hypothetical protein
MKTAEQLLDELLLDLQPPPGSVIALTEEIPKTDNDPNWISAIGIVPTPTLSRYQGKVGELRKSDPRVDWSNVSERVGERRRIAKRLSEVVQ